MFKSTAMYLYDITPRFGDIDGLRHVNNTVIPGWFEQARNQIYRYDFSTGHPVPIPAAIRERLREHEAGSDG